MHTAFIILSLLGFACSLNLYRPPSRPFPLAVASLFAGVLVGELTLFVMALQIAGTGLFIWAGAVTGWWAAWAMLLNIVSWLMLYNYTLESLQSADTLREQVRALSGTPRVQPRPSSLPLLLRPLSTIRNTLSGTQWQRCLRPFHIRLNSVRCLRDIPFATVGTGSTALHLDLYTPRRTVHNAPVLLYLHGGGLLENAGSKQGQGLPLLNEMADRGWIAASSNYRLSPTHRWPAHLQDCKTALLWIKEHIRDYGGNPDFVVVAGDSAGGQLAALMALTANQQQYQPAQPDTDTAVQGAICGYGVLDFGNLHSCQHDGKITGEWVRRVLPAECNRGDDDEQALLASANAVAQIHEQAPPFLLVHGDCDSLIAPAESELFARRLQAVSQQPVVHGSIGGAQHGFNMLRSPRGELVLEEVAHFAEWLHQRSDSHATGTA